MKDMFGYTVFHPSASTPSGGDVIYQPVSEAFLAKCRDQAAARYAAIMSAGDTLPENITGRCYFISPRGDDSADGLSPESAWRSCEKLVASYDILQEGDGVFFERGGEWNCAPDGCGQYTRYSGKYLFAFHPGVTYSAYGEGEKPVFSNSIIASGEENWLRTEYPGVWRYARYAGSDNDDIGEIVFDPSPKTGSAAAWGIKIQSSKRYNPFAPGAYTEECCTVSNGRTHFRSSRRNFTSPADLTGDLEFFHDHSCGDLFIRCEDGNPGAVFGEIRLLRRGIIIRGCPDGFDSDVTVNNLAIRYGGSHGIQTAGAKNVSVRNCEFGWIGGSVQDINHGIGGRYGNAFENWGDCDGLFVCENYVYQCYDTAITSQYGGGGDITMREAHFDDNLICYINSCFELWNSAVGAAEIIDCSINRNLLFCSGYGFGNQRPQGNKNGCFNLGQKKNEKTVMKNDVFADNIGVYATHFCTGDGAPSVRGGNGVTLKRNTYVLSRKSGSILRSRDDIPSRSGGVKCRYRYNRETAEYLLSLGIEKGSKFYYYDGFLFPEESDGAYYDESTTG